MDANQPSIDAAWHERWHVALDMNRDGTVTISDIWAWVPWLYYAPGDLVLLSTITYLPEAAKFLELDTTMLSGRLSGSLSAIFYLLWLVGVYSDHRR